jgi:hypothetical protein
MPATTHFSDHTMPGVSLQLDDDDRNGVAAWAGVLGLQLVSDRPVTCDRPFLSVKAERWAHDGDGKPVWLDFEHVAVCTFCEHVEAGEQA